MAGSQAWRVDPGGSDALHGLFSGWTMEVCIRAPARPDGGWNLGHGRWSAVAAVAPGRAVAASRMYGARQRAMK